MSIPGDAGLRLACCGTLAILTGAGWVLLGAAALALPWVAPAVGIEHVPRPSVRAALATLLMHGGIGAAFVWAGLGSIRHRRWAVPVMRTLAWIWLGTGSIVLGILALVLPRLPNPEAAAPSVRLILGGAVACGGVLLPIVLLLSYHDPRVVERCSRDPSAAWIDRCPPQRLLLAGLLVVGAALGLPAALQPAVPLFGRWVTGWPGAAATLAASGVCAWLACAVFRGDRRGLVGTIVFFLVGGSSLAWTLLAAEPGSLYRALGYPPGSLDLLEGAGALDGRVASLAVLAGTVGSAVYVAGLRRHFADPGR